MKNSRTKLSARIALILGLTCAWTSAQDVIEGVRTNFNKDATLAPDQVRSVIQLAKECGMSEFGEIGTRAIQPYNFFYAYVKTKERTIGRRSAYDQMDVYYSGWKGFIKLEKARQVNDFWVNPPFTVTFQFAEVTVKGKSYKVRMPDEISLGVAERIFGAFVDRRLGFEKKPDRWDLEDVESWKPGALQYDREKEEYTVHFYEPFQRIARVKLVGESIILTQGPSLVVH
jgi:hypothetical protein